MTTPMHWHAAHSNPNLQWTPGGGAVTSSGTTLARSSSHPPEMFCWEDERLGHQESRCVKANKSTQTEIDDIYLLPVVTQYIAENPATVMLLLGLDPSEFTTTLHDDDRHPLCSIMELDVNNDKPLSTIQETSSAQASLEDVSSSFSPPQKVSSEKLDIDVKRRSDSKKENGKERRSSFRRHRFSAGDLDSEAEKLLPTKATIPATRSLKFHPSDS